MSYLNNLALHKLPPPKNWVETKIVTIQRTKPIWYEIINAFLIKRMPQAGLNSCLQKHTLIIYTMVPKMLCT